MSLFTSFASYLFPKVIWKINSKDVLLTIDDSPTERGTEKLLNLLDKKNIKALFFVVGEYAEKKPNLIKLISNEGHLIGNHGFYHKSMLLTSKKSIIKGIIDTNNVVQNITGYSPKYFRPPYGRYRFCNIKELDLINMRLMMWSVLTYDFKNSEKIIKFKVAKIKSGSIIVMHDNKKTKNNIETNFNVLFDEMNRRGINFGDPTKCLK